MRICGKRRRRLDLWWGLEVDGLAMNHTRAGVVCSHGGPRLKNYQPSPLARPVTWYSYSGELQPLVVSGILKRLQPLPSGRLLETRRGTGGTMDLGTRDKFDWSFCIGSIPVVPDRTAYHNQ
jgi:hypothetical protein